MLDVAPFCSVFCCAEIMEMVFLTLLVDVGDVEILHIPDAISP